MRYISTLLLIFLFAVTAQAKQGKPIQVEIEWISVETKATKSVTSPQNGKIAILYKMKENIIRRELSFIPGKKWRKWA